MGISWKITGHIKLLAYISPTVWYLISQCVWTCCIYHQKSNMHGENNDSPSDFSEEPVFKHSPLVHKPCRREISVFRYALPGEGDQQSPFCFEHVIARQLDFFDVDGDWQGHVIRIRKVYWQGYIMLYLFLMCWWCFCEKIRILWRGQPAHIPPFDSGALSTAILLGHLSSRTAGSEAWNLLPAVTSLRDPVWWLMVVGNMSKRSFLRVLYAFDFQGDCWVLLGIVGLLGWEMCRLLLLRLAARSKCGISSANRGTGISNSNQLDLKENQPWSSLANPMIDRPQIYQKQVVQIIPISSRSTIGFTTLLCINH